MSIHDPSGTQPSSASRPSASQRPEPAQPAAPLPTDVPVEQGPRVGTIVWGLMVLALATLIMISKLGIVALNGTYVLIGLMIGAGAALVIGGLWSMRNRNGSGTSTNTLK